MLIPDTLKWLARHERGAQWLDRLPLLLDALADQWGLVPEGAAFSGGNVSYVVPVSREGERLVVKVQWPHDECLHEAEALRKWNGDGAVRLIEHDAARHALLLEACIPGTFLADAGLADPLGVFIDLLPRLWKSAKEPFRALSDEAAQWAAGLPRSWEDAGRPCEGRLIDVALEHIEALKETQGEQVLVHQDLHGHNVLAATREPWLAIDPKPLRGEREFALAPIVRSLELGHSEKATRRRLDRLCDELGLNRDRALGWAVAQTMAWGFGGRYDSHHHQTVRWLIQSR